MTQIINLKTTIERTPTGYRTCAGYEDEHGSKYTAAYPAEVSADWMRRWIESCRENDRGAKP